MTLAPIDTSGVVAWMEEFAPNCDQLRSYEFEDLPNDFVRGCVKAVCKEAGAPFHKLSGEALATILRDCALFLNFYPTAMHDTEAVRKRGAEFWGMRQRALGGMNFPPLHLTTADDGLIYFRSAENG